MSRRLLALSKLDRTMSIIDPASLEITAKVPTGDDPHEILSPDGKVAYITNFGGGSLHQIDIIDLDNARVITNFDTAPFMGPHGMQWVDEKLYFTAQTSKVIARYDPESGQVDWVMGTGQDFTHYLYVDPSAESIVAVNTDSGTVSFFDHNLLPPRVPPTGKLPATAKDYWDWVHAILPVGMGIEGMDVTADGKWMWTANPAGDVFVLDLEKQNIDQVIHAGIEGAHRVKLAEKGAYVTVVSVKTGELVVYDASSRDELSRIDIGAQGAGLLADDVDHRLFVSCTPQNIVRIIDLSPLSDGASPRVSRDLDVGGRPDALGWAVSG